jgi:hypothetical protein
MNTQTQTPETEIKPVTPETEIEQVTPLFPPGYLLLLAGAGFLLALFVLFNRREFDMVGWGGLGVGVISLIAWALMAPEQFISFLTGRALAYGGTAILGTVVFITALVAVYLVVQRLNLRVDVTDDQILSLIPETEDIIATIANDPTTPALKILAFLDPASADQLTLLFEDIGRASNNKITYQIVDADRDPLLAETYSAQNGQVFVVQQAADGTLLPDTRQTVPSLEQQFIVEAIISASATGDFRAYFLDLRDSLDFTSPEQTGGLIIVEELKNRYLWQTQVVSFTEFMRQGSPIILNDPVANGEVLVIAGGGEPLTDEQTAWLTEYLEQGGSLVLLAAQNFTGGTHSLATTPALGDYLYAEYGVRFYNDIVVDPSYSLEGTGTIPLARGFDPNNFITRDFGGDDTLVMDFTRSLEIAPQAPAGVTTTILATTFDTAYAKDNLLFSTENTDIQQQLQPVETDRRGILPLAVAAENTTNGSRVVLIGAETLLWNGYRQAEQAGTVNMTLARQAILWAANYENFRDVPEVVIPNPEQTPLILTQPEFDALNTAVIWVIPFGTLGVGILMWWLRRERGEAA